jgi:hypothetical protein
LVNLPEHEEFKKLFGNKAPTDKDIINGYQQIIVNLRSNYPKANIICTLGSIGCSKRRLYMGRVY